jgi:predicted dehydrogenase
MSDRLTRRRFLRQTAALGAAAALTGRLHADSKTPAPNDRLRLAVIGVANRGADNLKGVRGEEIVALCDVDADLLGKAKQSFPNARTYADFRVMLDAEAKNLDAVVVSTPDHTHAVTASLAMKMGKHVYCEKPLAHSVHEVRGLRELAAGKKLVTQMGTQIHAGNNYRRVVEIVQAGLLGTIKRVHVWCQKRPDSRRLAQTPVKVPASLNYDLWLGPAPERPYDPAFLPFHWRWWWDFGGGILADMACHYMDLAHWALELRTPLTVEASGKKTDPGDQEAPDLLQADYHYPGRGKLPGVHLTWYSGAVGPDPDATEPFHGYANGILFEGEKGQLLADYNHYLLLPEEQFKGFKPPAPTIPISVGHHREWLEAIRNHGATTCNFDYSGCLAETVLLGNVAFHAGQKLTWDETAGKVTDVKEANRFLRREYRKGWEL